MLDELQKQLDTAKKQHDRNRAEYRQCRENAKKANAAALAAREKASATANVYAAVEQAVERLLHEQAMREQREAEARQTTAKAMQKGAESEATS